MSSARGWRERGLPANATRVAEKQLKLLSKIIGVVFKYKLWMLYDCSYPPPCSHLVASRGSSKSRVQRCTAVCREHHAKVAGQEGIGCKVPRVRWCESPFALVASSVVSVI